MQRWLTRLGFSIAVGLVLGIWLPETAHLWTLLNATLMWRRVGSWVRTAMGPGQPGQGGIGWSTLGITTPRHGQVYAEVHETSTVRGVRMG